MICKDDKKFLWCGQSSAVRGHTFYSGEPETMEALRIFLYEHMGHNLTYGMHDNLDEEDGWQEVEAAPSNTNI